MQVAAVKGEQSQIESSTEYYRIRKSIGLLLSLLGAILVVTSLLIMRRDMSLTTSANRQIDNSLGPTIGATVPGLTGLDVSGAPLRVDFNKVSKKTILLVFSTDCPMCKLNWPAWRMLDGSVDKNSYRLVYVNAFFAAAPGYLSKQSQITADYLRRYQVGQPALVLTQADPGALNRYNIRLVPETILIDASGKIEKAWLGLLEGDQLTDVKRTLGL